MLSVINYQKFAHWLYMHRIPLLPKLIDYFIRLIFSCWFPHQVSSGTNLVLGYGGLGIVIHSDTKLGNNVHIDQGVTIGGNGTEFGVPVIKDNVYIGTGAKILGPITIEQGCIVAANAVVINDVPSNCIIGGVPAKIIRANIDINDTLYHLRKNK